MSGKVPFYESHSELLVTMRIRNDGLPKKPEKAYTSAWYWDDLWEICTACWARDPVDRPTMSAIVEKLVRNFPKSYRERSCH
jgi:hypothetical protein